MENTQHEIWARIPDYENYDVSNFGNVRSFAKNKNGTLLRKQLIGGNENSRYHAVRLYDEGKWKNEYVHRLVLQAFIGDPPEGYQTNHINGDKLDNRLENLEYVTPSENVKHSWKIGLRSNDHLIGNDYSRKLQDHEAAEIYRRLQKGERRLVLAEEFNVDPATITNIKRGYCYADVSGYTGLPIDQPLQGAQFSGRQAVSYYIRMKRGESPTKLAKEAGVTPPVMYNLKAGRSYTKFTELVTV